MLKFVIILTGMYILWGSLMKAAGKSTPKMPDNNHNEDEE